MLVDTLKFQAITLTCLPALIYQAKQTRKHTLRLPPPAGQRAGQSLGEMGSSSTEKQPFRLLVLGDSAAEGVGTDNQDDALLGQLVAQLSADHDVSYQLIANTGDTSEDVLHSLQAHISSAQCLTQLDRVVVSIGVNDVTTFTSVKTWQRNVHALIAILQQSLHTKHITFTAVPPMQHFPALPKPLNTWLGLRASMLNHALQAIVKQHEGVDFLQLDLSFDPELMAKDGFHPSAKTYSAWAESVLNLSLS